ncbi:hypothetical protein [Enterococcus faecium]|uniref:hypothetical protein n=1 Tax=Enterococcus faecium TaxID=1352 RepID=UPI003AAF498E
MGWGGGGGGRKKERGEKKEEKKRRKKEKEKGERRKGGEKRKEVDEISKNHGHKCLGKRYAAPITLYVISLIITLLCYPRNNLCYLWFKKEYKHFTAPVF